ncbi:MAG TPA: bifunctional acetate--CoA ligase family protein/GNAT family N-acetyltransferase [Fibrobacteria bacterium]|nr:bifunctional acetate--CoA ligase family protein/GNAT family N-acetyltransferase [Fibrobacteria bacterium]
MIKAGLNRPEERDPSNDILKKGQNGLSGFFHPASVAVVGATDKEGRVGCAVFRNLLANPSGISIIPVNPVRDNVSGVPAFPSISRIPGPVDLAIIITPASTVPGIIGECVEKGVSAAVILSAGFRETGEAGARIEQEVMEMARGKLRIIGPNCLGIMNPMLGLNATFAGDTAQPGNLAFLSQSGALCTAILDWSRKVGIGFSGFVSTGSMLDVGWGDLIDYFGDDPHTKAILIYMETIGDARSFLSAAREVALSKPIIVIKGGRTEEAAKAVSSHTGTLAGSDAVLDAAFRRVGVQRVDTIAELFYLAESLGQQPRPKGPKLTVVTNAGGPGVLSVDALISGGGSLAPLTPEMANALDAILPPHWSRNNPIDVIGDADPDRFAKAVAIAMDDPASDGVLAILTMQAMTDPTATAQKLADLGWRGDKPLLASWMGGASMEAGIKLLNNAGIPTFPFPDTAARIFNYMNAYQKNLRNLYETPQAPGREGDASARREAAAAILAGPWEAGRTTLTEWESKRLLQAYGIPVVDTAIARTEEQAVSCAQSFGYPVVLKLHSETLTHKTDVDGVILNLQDPTQVAQAFRAIQASVTAKAGKEHFQGVSVQPMIREKGYELILGGSVNPQFGPVILFGWGGTLVEVAADSSLALPPLNSNLARLLMERTRVYRALKGTRGKPPVNMAALQETLARFAQIMLDHPRIKEMDVNPFLVSDKVQIALDARVILHEREVDPADLPRPAIRPYPSQYTWEFTLANGRASLLRPIRPEDEPLMVKFHEGLSERTVMGRYSEKIQLDQRVAHDRLVRICFNDYDRSLALVAEMASTQPGQTEITAVGRMTKLKGGKTAEIAIVVEDRFQGQGLGRELVRRLLQTAADEGLEKVVAHILPTNNAMLAICRKLGFQMHSEERGRAILAEFKPGNP